MHLDINLVVLCGFLAVDAEPIYLDGGVRTIRFLVTVRTTSPTQRIDVIPVVLWDPPEALWRDPGERDDPVWVVGSVQRRFAEETDGGRSRIQVVAEQVLVGDLGEREPVAL